MCFVRVRKLRIGCYRKDPGRRLLPRPLRGASPCCRDGLPPTLPMHLSPPTQTTMHRPHTELYPKGLDNVIHTYAEAKQSPYHGPSEEMTNLELLLHITGMFAPTLDFLWASSEANGILCRENTRKATDMHETAHLTQ